LRRLLPFLLVVVFAAVGAAVDLFVLARAADLGVPVVALPLLWAVLHVVRAALSQPLGALSDRLGQRAVIGCGLVVHALVMLGFAEAQSQSWMWPLFAVHGLHAAFTEGAERGYVAALSGAKRRGSVFGVYHAVQGLSAFAGPVLLGVLWDEGGPGLAFTTAAGVSVVALVLLATVVPAAGARPGEGVA
jgi:MFS family permease